MMKPEIESGFRVERLGILMRPNPLREDEAEGVLNPGAARGPDGELYLFPRLVGRNNYSRIGIARVLFDDDGNPAGVERLGVALEPEEPYEIRPREGTGGVEDPRVTFVEPLGLYVMTYVAWGPHGPRVALAISEDCLDWERIGLVDFQPDLGVHQGVLFNHYDNKDAAFAPHAIEFPDGQMRLAMFHRPLYNGLNAPRGVKRALPAIWASACDLDAVRYDIRALRIMHRHMLVAEPSSPWESLRVGLGTPPIATHLGFMTLYHGVNGSLAVAPGERNHVTYDAGIFIFRRVGDRILRYRSKTPIMVPEREEEVTGAVDNVVFPTGIDKRDSGAYDVYYGMADRYIGVARLWLPERIEYDEGDAPGSRAS